MENHVNHSGYKLIVLKKLYQRSKNERKHCEDYFRIINKQYELIDQLRNENNKLMVSNYKLQSSDENESVKIERKNSLIKRHGVLQDELADMHKQNRKYAQQLTKLKDALDGKEKEIADKKTEIQKLRASLTSTKNLLEQVQLKLVDTENQCQFIKDEYTALHNILLSVEEKMQEGNCLIQIKAEGPDRIKSEKELFVSANNAEFLDELEEAKLQKESAEAKLQKESAEAKLNKELKEAKLRKEIEEAGKRPSAIDTNGIENIVGLDAFVAEKGQFKFVAHEDEVQAVAWTRSACQFATAGADRKVRMWNFSSGRGSLEGTASGSNSSIYSVDFDTEEKLMLAACNDASRIWTVYDMKIQHVLTGHSKKVMSAKFLSESGRVVSGSLDRTLKIWDLRRKACIQSIYTGSSVNDVIVSYSYGADIISGHFDKKIKFWDIRCGSCTNEILLKGRITSLDSLLGGYSLLASVRDDCLQLIDLRKNDVVRTFSSDGFLIGCDWTRAKFSPDGEYCVCGSQDGGVYIWAVSTGALKKVLWDHSSTVIACAWSWCGNYLLSCDRNKHVILRFEF